MIIRIRYKILGGHVHCRLLTSKSMGHTFAKCGDLVFSIEEWNLVRGILTGVQFMEEE